MRVLSAAAALVAMVFAGAGASATETVTYTYDAQGRLVKVVRTGSVNNNIQTDYTLDRASNRQKVKKTGAAS